MLMANADAQCIGGEGPAVTLGSPVLEVAAIGIGGYGRTGRTTDKKRGTSKWRNTT